MRKKVKLSELKEMIKHNYSSNKINEKKGKKKEKEEDDEDIDMDLDMDVDMDQEDNMNIDMESPEPGISSSSRSTEGADGVLDLLIQAKDDAEKLGDPKLMRQIGNTITMLTRKHIAGVDDEIPNRNR